MKEYLRNVALAFDKFLNVLLLNGEPKETISTHSAREALAGKKWACYLCKFLHWVDHHHCQRTLNGENTKMAAGLRLFGIILFFSLWIIYILPYYIYMIL